MSTAGAVIGLRSPDFRTSLRLGPELTPIREEIEGAAGSRWSRTAAHGGEGAAIEVIAGEAGGPIGPLREGAILAEAPKLRELLAALGTTVGWTRLIRLDPAEGPQRLLPPIDAYADERIALLIPIAGGAEGLEAGSAELLDPWSLHEAQIGEQGLLAVLSWLAPSSRLRALTAAGELAAEAEAGELSLERVNHQLVMAPPQLEALIARLTASLGAEAEDASAVAVADALGSLELEWRAIHAQHGPSEPGWSAYRSALATLDRRLAELADGPTLPEGSSLRDAARRMVVRGAFNPELARRVAGGPATAGAARARLHRPVFVIAPPCSGGEALAAALAGARRVAVTDPETGDPVDQMPALQPAQRGWDTERLTGSDAIAEVGRRFRGLLGQALRDASGEPVPDDASGIRLVRHEPADALRIPFLARLFPDAVFIYVHRDPRQSVAGMIGLWRSGEAVSQPELPGWRGPGWSLPLVPEWRKLVDRPLPEIAAEQWAMLVRVAVSDLEQLPPDRWAVVDYAELAVDEGSELQRLAAFSGLELDGPVPSLALDTDDVSVGLGDSERAELERALPVVERPAARVRAFLAGDEGPDPAASGRSGGGEPLRSVNTANFAEILGRLNSALLITTYQSGRLVVVRRTSEGGLNTHFRGYDSPMGLAVHGSRLAVGTRSQVVEYQNVPAVAAKIEPQGSHDGCFVPRRSHFTGDIRIHEIGYAADELWIVNTRFSCLATLDGDHSFVPRWRPPFITGYAAEDRCHLNGMAIVDDQVRYVSALGRSDTAGGWRENRATGGILMEVPSGEVIAGGISMPHSPRWYRDRLWVLESGEGAIGYVDLGTGRVETVAQVPGFTRGLAFAGPLAFIGLSEVRESMTFGGLPLTGRLEERECGVWVVNIETGQTVGFLRFEGSVQEIFAVELLRGMRFPEVVEHSSPIVSQAFVLPDAALAEVAPGAPGTPAPAAPEPSGPDTGYAS